MALYRPLSQASSLIRPLSVVRRSFFANPCSTDHTHLLRSASIHRLGNDDDRSAEYVLVPEGISAELVKKDPKLKLASIRIHNNIIFGARVINSNLGSMSDVCGSLLAAALRDASEKGEQPQAVATLNGLCEWVAKGINSEEDIVALQKLQADQNDVSFEAVKAIATGIPRPGHSVVGEGTYRDGRAGWEALAREFVANGLGEEVALYQDNNGELVAIEHLADRSEPYLRSAGGAMARFFFV